MNRKQDPALGTAPVGKLFWRLALPAIAAQLVNVLYNIVDRIYIGHIPEVGATALTGVGVTLPAVLNLTMTTSLPTGNTSVNCNVVPPVMPYVTPSTPSTLFTKTIT